MKMNSIVKYINSELKISSKGNQYKISNFIQEGSVDVLSCVDTTDFNLNFGDEIEAVFDYNPKYQKLSFVGIQ